MLVMKYAEGGDLHDYLQKNFTKITWKRKIEILLEVSKGYLYLNISIILFIIY